MTLRLALVVVIVSTVLGTLLGLALARVRFRGRGAAETLLLLPMVTPEIIMGLSLLVFFFQLFGARGSFVQLVFAHITFCISYVAIVVRARAAGMNAQLEEAARDLGASAFGAFRFVTLPLILPAVISGALLAFALSFDDYVVTTFNAGVGSSTLPIYIYGKVKFGVTPEINAISTIIVAVTAIPCCSRGVSAAVAATTRSWPSRSRRSSPGPSRHRPVLRRPDRAWTTEPYVGTPPGIAPPGCFERPGSRSRPTRHAASRSRTSDSDAPRCPACSC